MEANKTIELIRTNSSDTDFIDLVVSLDKDLAIRDGEDHDFYQQFNQLDDIKHVVVAYDNQVAVGCSAIKRYDDQRMEVKRMYTSIQCRGRGVASKVLRELENWAKEFNCEMCILETGVKYPEAIALYKKNEYVVVSNYGQYQGKEDSICFSKTL